MNDDIPHTKIPVKECVCGYKVDASTMAGVNPKTGLPHDRQPKEGDVSLCLKCGRPYIFNADLSQRDPTEEELKEVRGDKIFQLAQEAIYEINRRRNDTQA